MTNFYELRVASFPFLSRPGITSHGSFSTDPGYWCETDTPIDWEDRANKEDCWRDWWDADWIDPEEDE